MLNEQPVVIQHTSTDPELWCFDVEAVGCCIFDCGDNYPCAKGKSVAKLTTNTVLDFIPEVNVLGVEELEKLKVTPNLTTSHSTIEVSIPYSKTKTNLRIQDIQGRLIFEETLVDGVNHLPLGKILSATYVITIQNADYTFSKKIIIQN